ncbi:MAG: ABC transporter permease [Chloroflexota bacterium]|nr:ABC transporter permease [Chloroflexota bacterium]
MNAFAQHFAYEFKTGLRNPSLLLINYLFPLGFYAMMGLIMTAINPLFTAFMVPALVIFAIIASTVLGMPSPLVEAREAGVFRSYEINGVPAASILAIPGLTTGFHALISGAIIALTAPVLFGGDAPVHVGAFVGITLLTAFTCASMGMLISVISDDSRATILWSQLLFLPSMLIGGLMVPLDTLPERVLSFSALLPASHAMELFTGWAYGRPTVFNLPASAAILASSGVLALVLSIVLFNWDTRNQSRRGHPLLALLVIVPYAVGALLAI